MSKENVIKDLLTGLEACSELANENHVPMIVCFPVEENQYHITGGGSDVDLCGMMGAMMECDERFYKAAALALTIVTKRKAERMNNNKNAEA